MAQLGIWVAQMLDPRSPVYNIAEYIEIVGPIELDVLASSDFLELVGDLS